jgi:hypothetical protein
MDGPILRSIAVADPPETWRAAGFAVDENRARVGAVEFELVGEGGGIISWAVDGTEAGDVDGLDTRGIGATEPRSAVHPNGATSLDHLVITSHDVERTVAALTARGFEVRRRWLNAGRCYTFFRVGEAILELIGPAEPDGKPWPARFYGLAFTVSDIEATAARLGPLLGPVRDALQPGRRIATLARQAGLSVPVAFMSEGKGAI